MKQIERIKSIIAGITDPMEMAGCLEGINGAARLFCKEHFPEEVIAEKDGHLAEVSVYGLVYFLESEADPGKNV